MVANGNIKNISFPPQFSKEKRLRGEQWSFIHPSVPIPATVTEFDFGADISEILKEALEPGENPFLSGGVSD